MAAATTTIRVNLQTHRRLQELAREANATLPEIVDRLVEADRRRRLFERANAAYTALQADPAAWEQELAERRAWATTLADGLEEPPVPPQEETGSAGQGAG